MMFNVADGGIVEPISLDTNNLQPNKSIILVDEENLRVWLWHGKARLLVPRRTALRQAESLKGHGYQAGNAIVGRGMQDIVEIDDRKVGHDPDTTKMSEQFMAIVKRMYRNIGDNVYVPTSPDDKEPAIKPKAASSPAPASTPSPTVEEKKKVHEIAKPTAELKAVESNNSAVTKYELNVKCPDEHSTKVAELEKKLATAENKIKDLEGKVTTAQNKNMELGEKLAIAEGKIVDLESNLKNCESTKKVLEAKISSNSTPTP